MTKGITKHKIYENSKLSFKFEFKSPIRRRDMASKLSKNIGKKVKWFKGVDESFKPTDTEFKLSNKYSEKSKTFVFETGFIHYNEATQVMLKAMNLIDHFGYTDDRCEMQVNIGLVEGNIAKLNKFKYLIGLNEEKILDTWNTHASERHKVNYNLLIDIKNPYSTILSNRLIERVDPQFFNTEKSDFYGTDFSKLNEGYVITNYIGGSKYQLRKQEALDTINSIATTLHETAINNYTYNDLEKKTIEGILEYYRGVVTGTKNYQNFKSTFPDVRLYVDLMNWDHVIEAHYSTFKEKLFDLVSKSQINEAEINWDNTRKKMQIKNATIDNNMVIKDVEFYNCIIEADATNCTFNNCTIRHSKLDECDIISGNYIKNSKVLECEYHGTMNEISNSYIDNDKAGLINAELTNCVVNKGSFAKESTIDDQTVRIDKND
jgi:uncharacterized protein YjbI with pentapeptide repeats